MLRKGSQYFYDLPVKSNLYYILSKLLPQCQISLIIEQRTKTNKNAICNFVEVNATHTLSQVTKEDRKNIGGNIGTAQ